MFNRSKRAQKIRELNPPIVVVPYKPIAIPSDTKAKSVPHIQFAQVHAIKSDVDRVKQRMADAERKEDYAAERRKHREDLSSRDSRRSAKMRYRNRKTRKK